MRVLGLSLIFVLAACGGGGASAPASGDPGGPVGTVTGSGRKTLAHESEPNDSLATANPITIPTPSATDDFVGADMSGSINDMTDVVDVFALTAPRARVYRIELCDGCTSASVADDELIGAAFFEILDQSGVLLLSTEGGGIRSNKVEFEFASGVLNYVAVHAENTMNADQSYTLITQEKWP